MEGRWGWESLQLSSCFLVTSVLWNGTVGSFGQLAFCHIVSIAFGTTETFLYTFLLSYLVHILYYGIFGLCPRFLTELLKPLEFLEIGVSFVIHNEALQITPEFMRMR